MPQVEFHSGVAEPLRFACRLLRKASRQGASLVVTAPLATLQALDRELWVFEAAEFIPHLRVQPDQTVDATLQRTPIWLCEGQPPLPCPVLWVNIGGAMPNDLQPFERIIEIVSEQPQERQDARQRWRDYEARGWIIKHHTQAGGA